MQPPSHNRPNRALLVAAATACLLLGACGFHLRGSHELAPELGRLNVAAPIDIQRQLRRSLANMGVQVPGMGETIPEAFSLRVENTEVDTRTISFDENVDAAEIEFRREIVFELLSPEGVLVLGPVRIDVERVYVHDRDRLLGETGEKTILDREMDDEASQRIIRHLRRLSSEQIRSRIEASQKASS